MKEETAQRHKETKTNDDDNSTYDGEWVKSWGGEKSRDGLGVSKWENGKYLDGLWSNDKFIKGKIHNPVGAYQEMTYEGECKGNELSGYGKLSYQGWNFFGYCIGEYDGYGDPRT